MFGAGLLKGLGVTFKHLAETYTDDMKPTPSRYQGSSVNSRSLRIIEQPVDQEGLLTIQYPEERRLLPERFRYIPMLIWDSEIEEERCTACGICAKVCPPQCIWITRATDEQGKPVTRPQDFFIDATVCMSCNYCVEFCPFDAIKMDHDFELAAYERHPHLVYDISELTVPLEYYAALWPEQYAKEQEALALKRAEEKAKAEQKAAKQAEAKPASTKPAANSRAEELKAKAKQKAREKAAARGE